MKKNLTKQTKETKPGKPTQDCRRCPDCAVENLHVLDVTFPLGRPILLLILVERIF